MRLRVLFPLAGLACSFMGLFLALLVGEWSLLRVLVAIVVAVDMELMARWMHRDLWHAKWLWWIHASHHGLSAPLYSIPGDNAKGFQPKRVIKGVLEANDVFAAIFAVAATLTLEASYKPPPALIKDLAFGTAIGFTFYGIMYFIGHDLIAHRRGGPELADALARLAPQYISSCAHAHVKYHHSGNDDSRPYGFFLPEVELTGAEDRWFVKASHRATQAVMLALAGLGACACV
ncbi:Beta-carotene 3-hydroxylase, chloroplastic [Hondaea fermentalgiana]|uniref:beta-carotene 3-hydroxylase n=1 Tax=Hondaea fermentalgiana TaxID=2315210 RepID=A0A2R5GA90_9STRA|nr:Beta-carotene 3-hydroxylase, chloroplastic [Hondaea fermentalgiana]|eukprot:GBG26648.1 Beta-carotene 3-hydroxylase, chloroplastic [Hondaea fermentalgiana]